VPLSSGTVTFIPIVSEREGGRPGVARIESDGSFEIGNANPEKPRRFHPGEYKVTVLAMKPVRPHRPGAPVAVQTTPPLFESPRTTPLTAVIRAGASVVEIDLSETAPQLEVSQPPKAE